MKRYLFNRNTAPLLVVTVIALVVVLTGRIITVGLAASEKRVTAITQAFRRDASLCAGHRGLLAVEEGHVRMYPRPRRVTTPIADFLRLKTGRLESVLAFKCSDGWRGFGRHLPNGKIVTYWLDREPDGLPQPMGAR
jgi:hypothetical protein